MYAYHILTLLPQRFVGSKYHFLAFFGPDIKTVMAVIIYMNFKHSPDCIDPKYIEVHGSNSLGSNVCLFLNTIVGIFSLIQEKG